MNGESQVPETLGRHVTSMAMERVSVNDSRLQAGFDADQMSDWVNWLAPWEIIAHLTWKDWIDRQGFAHGITTDGARKAFEGFMRRELPGLSYFYAVEQNPSREGSHVHALWADCRSLWRKGAWSKWFARYGRARIEPVRNHGDVSAYCAKHLVSSYTTKAPIWWNVKLQWYRVQAMHGSDFSLAREDCGRLSGARSSAVSLPSVGDLVVENRGDSHVELATRSPSISWVRGEDGVFYPELARPA